MRSTLKSIPFIFALIFTVVSCEKVKKSSPTLVIDDPATSSVEVYNGDVLINHKTYGNGPVTLLFVHGWGINQSYWLSQIDELKSDYRIVTVDLPGFGESGKNRQDWSIEKYGTDITEIIEKLKLTNVILIGHSMGGDIILETALGSDQVLALIGIDNFKDVGVDFTDEIKTEIDGFINMLKNNYSEVAPAFAEGSLFHPSTDSLVKNRVISNLKLSDSTIAVVSLESAFNYSLKEAKQLSQLKQRLYLINSNASPTNTNGLDATGVVYQVIDIDATGHYPMIEKPKEFNRLLKETIQVIENTLINN